MPKRTEIVCLHEGTHGHSIDPTFINRLMKELKPSWIRSTDNGSPRLVDCGSRSTLLRRFPEELRAALRFGSSTTVMVWADVDDDMSDCDALEREFWRFAEREGVTRAEFETAVFVFAKDRLENWIEFLSKGATDESKEGPRIKSHREAADAARKLAEICRAGTAVPDLPASLKWSCTNWHRLKLRLK